MEIRKISKKEFYEDKELESRIAAELKAMGVTEKDLETHIGGILQKMGIEVVDRILSEDEKNAELVSDLIQDDETLEMVSGGAANNTECYMDNACDSIVNNYNEVGGGNKCMEIWNWNS